MCKATMPQRRRPPVTNQTRRVRQTRDENDRESPQYSQAETYQEEQVDAEAALYIKELTVHWLADTESPRSFMNISTAGQLVKNTNNAKKILHNNAEKYRCFNNN